MRLSERSSIGYFHKNNVLYDDCSRFLFGGVMIHVWFAFTASFVISRNGKRVFI